MTSFLLRHNLWKSDGPGGMKKILFKTFVVLSSAFLLIILIFFTDSFDALTHIATNAKIGWLAVGFGCMAAYWLLDAVILQIITATMHKGQRMSDSIKVTMIGQFFHSITPFAGGGEPVQAYIMVKDGLQPGVAASIFAVKTILHELIIVLYAIAAYLFYGAVFTARIPQFNYFFVAGLVLNAAFLAFTILLLYKAQAAKKVIMFFCGLLEKIKLIKNRTAIENKINCEVTSFREGAVILKKDRKSLLTLPVVQILQFTFIFAVTFFIQLAVESQRVALPEVVAAQSMIMLISLLVPTPGATGGVEGISYLFFGMFFRKDYIIPVILIYRLLTYYPSVLFGGLFTVLAPEKPLKRETMKKLSDY